MKNALVMMTVVMLLVDAVACSQASRVPKAATPGVPNVTVMTYNVNYGLVGDVATINAIRDSGADVVFLQETTPAWEIALRSDLSDEYPHMAFRHSGGVGGLGVLSKYVFEEKEFISAPAGGWFPAWRLVVTTALGAVQLLTVHLHPPISESGSVVMGYFSTDDIRLDEMKKYYAYLDTEIPTIVLGDFNESKDGDAIEYLEAKGLKSALPEFAGSLPTWHWQTSVGTITSQLDHIVYNDRLEPLDVEVLLAGSSDHFPVKATFAPAKE